MCYGIYEIGLEEGTRTTRKSVGATKDMSLNNVFDTCRDVRTIDKMKQDIEINVKLGKKAIEYFAEWLNIYREDLHTVWTVRHYEEKVWQNENDIEYKQDADLIGKGKIYPIEIKVTRFAFPHRIFVRKSSINKLSNNGYLYLSENKWFHIMKKQTVLQYPIEKVKEWGNKECYIIKNNELRWEKHIEALQVN